MTDTPDILWLDDAAAVGNPALGGKFASLAEMTAAEIAVPPGFGITTAAYRRFLEHAELGDEVRRVREKAPTMELADIRTLTADLLEAIRTAPLPPDLEDKVRESYAELERRAGRSQVPVAVRSSGESEDLAGASFAGQYQTYLWICGAEAVLANMRACWAGMFGETVLSYQQDGESVMAGGDFGICVGVQQMVEARAAGVMFTLDPLNGDRSKIALEACWGLGEGVVGGDVSPSRYTIDKVTFEIIRRTVTPQPNEYRFVPESGGVEFTEIEPERQEEPCLADVEIRALAEQAKGIEKRRGAPQDIEWAVSAGGDVRILQVRPETVWSRKPVSGLGAAGSNPVSHVLSRLSGARSPASSPEGEAS